MRTFRPAGFGSQLAVCGGRGPRCIFAGASSLSSIIIRMAVPCFIFPFEVEHERKLKPWRVYPDGPTK